MSISIKFLDWIDVKKLDWDYLRTTMYGKILFKKYKNVLNYNSQNDKIYRRWIRRSSSLLTINEVVHWKMLSSDTSLEAIDLLRFNQDKIDWYCFSRNPSIIEYDSKNCGVGVGVGVDNENTLSFFNVGR